MHADELTIAQPARKAAAAMNVLWRLLRDAVISWIDDYAPSMGAALAFRIWRAPPLPPGGGLLRILNTRLMSTRGWSWVSASS